MCLIAFAWQAHARFPLVVAANRDEFFERPTAAASWWPGDRIVAGRDLRGGGTWMGATRDGGFAALTNYREPSAMRADAPSRGALVRSVLESTQTLDEIAAHASRFNGFNLLAARSPTRSDAARLWIVSSRATPSLSVVAPGIHGLSNALLDTPWQKVQAARAALRDALAAEGESDADRERLCTQLFALLDDDARAPDDALPTTGLDRDLERALSSAFIRMPGYGTRSSTVLIVDCSGEALYVERRTEPLVDAAWTRFVFPIVA